MLRYLFALLILLSVSPVLAAGAERLNPDLPKAQAGQVDRQEFNAAEKHIIRSGLLGERRPEPQSPATSNLPRGLSKQLGRGQSLPPGWQRRVIRGKRLDYHLYRQGKPLPAELLQRLPSSPAETTLIRIGDSILRLEAATRIVLDMFDLHRQ